MKTIFASPFYEAQFKVFLKQLFSREDGVFCMSSSLENVSFLDVHWFGSLMQEIFAAITKSKGTYKGAAIIYYGEKDLIIQAVSFVPILANTPKTKNLYWRNSKIEKGYFQLRLFNIITKPGYTFHNLPNNKKIRAWYKKTSKYEDQLTFVVWIINNIAILSDLRGVIKYSLSQSLQN